MGDWKKFCAYIGGVVCLTVGLHGLLHQGWF